MNELLSLKGVTKRYGKVVALKDVSFSIAAGEIVALVGSNGSGKTTTIRSICRLIACDAGDIYFDGSQVDHSNAFLKQMGVVLEGSRNCHWRLNPVQNARYFAGLRGFQAADLEQRIDRLIRTLGLHEYRNREVGKLSTGNRQKTALLCSLVFDPKLILLDEPTLGLDLETTEALKQVITRQVTDRGMSFLITSHDLNFIDAVCDRVLIIEKGSIVFDGTLPELKNRLFKYELNVAGPALVHEKMRAFIGEEGLESTVYYCEERATTSIKFNDIRLAIAALSRLHEKHVRVDDLSIQPLSMETAYVELLEGKL